jgi:molecular chaperone HscC
MAMNVREAMDLLGVEPGASPDEVRRAWLRAVRKHRPERDPEGFKRVTEAYELLRDLRTMDDDEDRDLGHESDEDDDPMSPQPAERRARQQDWAWVVGSFGQGGVAPPPNPVTARVLRARHARSYLEAAELVLAVGDPGRIPVGREVLLSIAAGCVADGNVPLGRAILALVEQTRRSPTSTTDRNVDEGVVWELFQEVERAPPAFTAVLGKAVAEGDPLLALHELRLAQSTDEVPVQYLPLATTPELARFMKDYVPGPPLPWAPDLFPPVAQLPFLFAALALVALLVVRAVWVPEAPTPGFPPQSFVMAAIRKVHPESADLVHDQCTRAPKACRQWVTLGLQASCKTSSLLTRSSPARPGGPVSPILGIDLGTTHSLVATIGPEGPVVLPNSLGRLLTPSCVHVADDGSVLVGEAAKSLLRTDPGRTIASFKRDMGTDTVYRLGTRSFTPVELSALVLRALKTDAEAALGTPVHEAVVTIPAYFDEAQRQATRNAAALAGLSVQRLVHEPTAAAMAFGLNNLARELTAVVLDLGGGTFDVTALALAEQSIEVRGTAGDIRLGGDDFTEAVAGWITARLRHEQGVDATTDPRAMASILEEADRAKCRLSGEVTARVSLPRLGVHGKVLAFEAVLTRAEAEKLWAPILARMEGPMKRAVADAGLRLTALDEILLVGGASRMPCVAALAEAVFGKRPQRTLAPDLAIAQGAAIQSALYTEHRAVDDLVVIDITPHTLGVATVRRTPNVWLEDIYTPLIERGTPLPATKKHRFSTIQDHQQAIDFKVYQGEHPVASKNKLLRAFTLAMPPGPAPQHVIARLQYDLSGLVNLEVQAQASGVTQRVSLSQATGSLTEAQVEAARARLDMLAVPPLETLPNRAALARAEARWAESTGSVRDEIGGRLVAFRAALETEDRHAIEQARTLLTTFLDHVEA